MILCPECFISSIVFLNCWFSLCIRRTSIELTKKYRKIPKISLGAYIFQRPFLRGLYSEGLIYGGKFAFQNQLGFWSKFTFFLLCFSLYLRAIFHVQTPRGFYLEGRFNGGFFALPVREPYIWKGLFSEFYGITRSSQFNINDSVFWFLRHISCIQTTLKGKRQNTYLCPKFLMRLLRKTSTNCETYIANWSLSILVLDNHLTLSVTEPFFSERWRLHDNMCVSS